MSIRRVSIYGSTGSVGRSAADVILHARQQGIPFETVALAAGRNTAILAEHALALRPQIAVIADDEPSIRTSRCASQAPASKRQRALQP